MRRRLLVALLWLLGCFACAAHYCPFFRLRDIRVEGARGASSEAVAALLTSAPGVNIFAVDLAAWTARTAALPAVQSARAHVTLGGTAVIRVAEARPVCLVDTRPVAGVAADGTILPLDRHPAEGTVPLVTGIGGEPHYYRRARQARLLTALQFYRRWQSLADHRERLAEIHVNPALEVGVYLWPDQRFVTLGRGDWSDKLKDLWPVVRRLPPGANPLDLRFSGQVVERL